MTKNNKMTIEKLAEMVAEGFANTATKDDIKELRSELKADLANVERRLIAKIEVIDEKVDTLEEADVRNLQRRVFVLEKDVKQIKQKNV
jgi:polyhydroxyalkanoate synthesis regulator phasin